MRFRYVFMAGGSLALLLALAATDPDTGLLRNLPFGASVIAWVLSVARGVVAVAGAHWGYKAMFDYPEADGRGLYRSVRAGSMPAAVALLARAIITVALLLVFAGPATAQVPARALQYLPTLAAEQAEFWPSIPLRTYLPGLVEHESCISLTHSRCWSPTSRLKTQREEGAGFGQITRAWTRSGELRFDALAEMRDRHPALHRMDWDTIYERPDLQLRALVLKSRDNFEALAPVADPLARLQMADAAYNGGLGGVRNERRACGLTEGCDPQLWFGNVERTCLKSRRPLYGTRSPCDINRHHVADVFLHRAPKYEGLL